ncbi:MAG: glutamyl-tRNA reductase [Halanaeroarchaeum sp.]
MNRYSHVVTGARVAHDDADVCDLEAARRETERELLADLRADPAVDEAFALQTCHRVEVYAVTSAAEEGRAALAAAGFGPDDAVQMDHEASVRHLMRVAAGLESMIVGEDQILGQVKDAFELAKAVGTIGPLLSEAVPKAIRVGERARTETAINEGVVSLGSAAVTLAEEEYGLAGTSATVVGVGEMGTLTAKSLAGAGVESLSVANRTRQNAEDIVRVHDLAATVVDFDALADHLAETDVVVTATGAEEPVLTPETLADAGVTYVIDLGQPRDVAPAVGELAHVTLRDLDDLTAVTEATRAKRSAAAEEVRAIIDEEYDRLLSQYKRKRADEVIGAMYEGADRIKRRELQTATSKLAATDELTDEQRKILETFADSLISQLLAAPTRALRDAAEDDDWSTIATAIRLFEPEFADPEDVANMLVPGPEATEDPQPAATESEDD